MRRGALVLLFACICGAAAAEIRYRTELVGIDDPALAARLREASQLVALADRPPDTEVVLARRAADDLDRLGAVLRSEGYYDASAAYEIDTEQEPAVVTVRIEPGPRYTLAAVRFVGDGGAPLPLLADYAPLAFGLNVGGPAVAAPVVAAEERIARLYRERGFPFARVADRKVVVDKAAKTMEVTYSVAPGRFALFGPTSVAGLDRLGESYVRQRIPWYVGEPYDVRLVERARSDLVSSGLFSVVRIRLGEVVGGDGRVPVEIAVTERPPRSIGAGISYGSAEGFSTRAYWEHRNLFGEAERLRLRAEVGQQIQDLTATFRKPDLGRTRQDLVARLTFAHEDVEAYESTRARAFTGLEWRVTDQLAVGAGGQIERVLLTDVDEGITNYSLVGAPAFLRHDTTDSLLDPTVGARQTVTVTPYMGISDTDLTFVSSRFVASAYRALDDRKRFVLAGYGAVGSIVGEPLSGIPRDKRLFVGGGGSVRGYAFQKVGPLDASGDPVGGRSSLEAGIELRIKITDTIGVAPFLEGGNVYRRAFPSDLDLFYGTGLGFRYYTPIGPVRLDIGIPLDRRPEDDAFQVYISLGQAF